MVGGLNSGFFSSTLFSSPGRAASWPLFSTTLPRPAAFWGVATVCCTRRGGGVFGGGGGVVGGGGGTIPLGGFLGARLPLSGLFFFCAAELGTTGGDMSRLTARGDKGTLRGEREGER